MKNNPIKPHCGHHVPHTPPVRLGEINYTSEQINALLGMIPFKADRAEVPEMEKLSDVNYVGHVVDPSLLVYQSQPSWALVGSLKRAKPYFYYVEGYVPKGYTAGWNDISPVLGTYDLTADKVSIFDFNLVTEYNVSRNHPNIKRDFNNDWGMAKFYYPEYDEYKPCKVYNEGDRVNMPDYTENTFIALRETSQPPFITIEVSSEFTLGEAVAITPEQYRYPGIRLTFVNSKTHQAETWFWLGGEWEDEKKWIKPISDVTINNLPDEEDISTTKDSIPRLQLKDKQYDRNSYSGLGRVYLRKNIVNGVNVLTQDMMMKENTRYIVQYDYELNNTLELPDGSIFDFQGGSIKIGDVIVRDNIVRGHEMGMLPNVVSAAKVNSNKIAYFLNLGFTVIVDDVYYISTIDTILNHVSIVGINRNTSKLIVTEWKDGSAFIVSSSVHAITVNNMTIDTTTEKGLLNYNILFEIQNSVLPNLRIIEFDNLTVSGVRLILTNSPDVDMSTWGINKIALTNIDANELDQLAVFNNTPYDLLLVDGVRVKNGHRAVIYSATNNQYANQASLYRKKTVVRNCSLENDFIQSEYVAYLCFILVEGVECHYYNNTVKNVICTETDSVVYDAYLTCDVLYYYNNNNYNVANLDVDGNNDIYKCKECLNPDNRTLRYIAHNSYTMEKSYFEKHGVQDLSWCIKLGNSTSTFNVFEYIDNYVNIEFGKFCFGNFVSGSEKAIISKNIIKAANATSQGGVSLMFMRKNSIVEITDNRFIFDNIDSAGFPALFRYIESIKGSTVTITNNTIKNCNLCVDWEATPIDYASFKEYVDTWNVYNNNVVYDKGRTNLFFILNGGKLVTTNKNEFATNMIGIYSIINCRVRGPFTFDFTLGKDTVREKSRTYQYACEFLTKGYPERCIIQLTYDENGTIVKTRYENVFGEVKEYNNQEYASDQHFIIFDYYSLIISSKGTRLERNFKWEDSTLSIYYVDSHTDIKSCFRRMGGRLEDMAYDHPLGVPYICTDKRMPEGKVNHSVIWRVGNQRVDSLGRYFNMSVPNIAGRWDEKPDSSTTLDKPNIGQGYFCTNIQSETEGEYGKMIYFKGQDTGGNDVWVDALGRVVTN